MGRSHCHRGDCPKNGHARCQRPPRQTAQAMFMTKAPCEDEARDWSHRKYEVPEKAVQNCMPAQLVRRRSEARAAYRIHVEEARSEKTHPDDRQKYRACFGSSALAKFFGNSAREDQEEDTQHDEVSHLDPAARTERQFADEHPACLVTRR